MHSISFGSPDEPCLLVKSLTSLFKDFFSISKYPYFALYRGSRRFSIVQHCNYITESYNFFTGASFPAWIITSFKETNPAELLHLYLAHGYVLLAAVLAVEYIEAALGNFCILTYRCTYSGKKIFDH